MDCFLEMPVEINTEGRSWVEAVGQRSERRRGEGV